MTRLMDLSQKFHEELAAVIEIVSNRATANSYRRSAKIDAIPTTEFFKKLYGKRKAESSGAPAKKVRLDISINSIKVYS